jgi:hypothetical protein
MRLSLSAPSDAVLALAACVIVGIICSATLKFARIVQAGSTDRTRIRADRDVKLVELAHGEKTTICIDMKANESIKEPIPDASRALNTLAKRFRLR